LFQHARILGETNWVFVVICRGNGCQVTFRSDANRESGAIAVGSLTVVESVNNHQLGVKADTAMRSKQMEVMRFAKRLKLTRAKSPLKTRL
jgi:hypothetical protein